MLRLRHKGVDHKCAKVVVDALSDPTAMETIVTAQHGMLKLQEMVQRTNISIMKLYSLLTWTAPKVKYPIHLSFVSKRWLILPIFELKP